NNGGSTTPQNNGGSTTPQNNGGGGNENNEGHNNNKPPEPTWAGCVEARGLERRHCVATSTFIPPQYVATVAPAITYLAAQTEWRGSTVYEGRTYVQSTVTVPVTTVYISSSVISSPGEAPRTTAVAYTTVIPPGTVVINEAIPLKKSNTVAIVAGALGGAAVLVIIGLIVFFTLRRRRRRRMESQGALSEIDPDVMSRRSAGGVAYDYRRPSEPNMAEVGRNNTIRTFTDQRDQTTITDDSYGPHTRGLVVQNQSSSTSLPFRNGVNQTRTSIDDVSSTGGASSSMYTSPHRSARGLSPQPGRYGSGSHHQHMSSADASYGGGGGGGMGMVHEEDGGGPFADYGQQRGGAQILDDPFVDHGPLDPPPPLTGLPPSNGVFVHEDGGSIRSFRMTPDGR
ncbi:hypothetical protein EST38_g12205, partial [Candolleomyces aberdarensis]